MLISSREEDNIRISSKNIEMISSEESSSYPEDSELELGLGLSINSGSKANKYQYARFLTAEDFASGIGNKDSSSSSSSSTVAETSNGNGSCGVKRTAESSSPPGRSQVVGWPPVRTYRINSLANHAKSPVTKDFFLSSDECKSNKNVVIETDVDCGKNDNHVIANKRGSKKSSTLFVKVNMDGIPIGRKVDLSAHSSYETLALVLDDMFTPSAALVAQSPNVGEQIEATNMRKSARLLDDSSDYVLTYEDKDGDWMLVGDVPWEMFLSSARRLRIVKRTEANGVATPRMS